MGKEETIEKLKLALPHMRYAVEEAAKNGEVKLAVCSQKPSGDGEIECVFDALEFLEAVAEVIDAGPLTDEQRESARAEAFLHKFGLG